MTKNSFNIFLKFSAFLLPVYFIFYGPLHENPDNPKAKSLWKYTIAGFIVYLVLGLIYL